jgi:hypothetical protein
MLKGRPCRVGFVDPAESREKLKLVWASCEKLISCWREKWRNWWESRRISRCHHESFHFPSFGLLRNPEPRHVEYLARSHRGLSHSFAIPRPHPPPPASIQFRDDKIIYRRYAGLFFCCCVDSNDNELAYLEAIHLFVEVLGEWGVWS